MTFISAQKCAQYAHEAGFATSNLVLPVAIAIAESALNTRARYAPGTGEDSRGLWQINIGGRLWPARRISMHLSSPDDLYDPATNARCAHQLYTGRGNFNDWATYLHKTYEKHLGTARAGAQAYLNTIGGDHPPVPTPVPHGILLTRYLRNLRPQLLPLMHGTDVAAWQHRAGIIGTGAHGVDGIFGDYTEQITKAWQLSHHLVPDGIVGPKTAAAAGWTWV